MSTRNRDDKKLGNVVKAARRDKGLTQVELAAVVDMSQRWVSDLERGIVKTPRMTTLSRLSKALNLPLELLVVLSGLADSDEGAKSVLTKGVKAQSTYGEIISQWRWQMGISKSELAQRTGLSLSDIEAIERDEMGVPP